MIKQGMIMAAGYGTRMQPVTLEIPKPMIEVSNISLIERMILRFYNAGINRILINTHYLADKLTQHIKEILSKHQLNQRLELEILYEKELLETGGGAKNALHFFDNNPFFIANSDSIWVGKHNIFNDLEDIFSKYQAPMVLLVVDKSRAIGFDSNKSDFVLRNDKLYITEMNDQIYTGLQILDPSSILHDSRSKFSLYEIFKKLVKQQKLYGVKFTGDWLHVGDLKDLEIANNYFRNL